MPQAKHLAACHTCLSYTYTDVIVSVRKCNMMRLVIQGIKLFEHTHPNAIKAWPAAMSQPIQLITMGTTSTGLGYLKYHAHLVAVAR